MKKLLLFVAVILSVSIMNGQGLPADNLLTTLTLKAIKLDDWLAKKKFFFTSTARHGDTLVKIYNYKPLVKKNKPVDSVDRSIIKEDSKDEFTITYHTTSQQEFEALKVQLKEIGFYCNQDDDRSSGAPLLFQLKDETVTICSEIKDSSTTIRSCFIKRYSRLRRIFTMQMTFCVLHPMNTWFIILAKKM